MPEIKDFPEGHPVRVMHERITHLHKQGEDLRTRITGLVIMSNVKELAAIADRMTRNSVKADSIAIQLSILCEMLLSRHPEDKDFEALYLSIIGAPPEALQQAAKQEGGTDAPPVA